MAFSVSVVSVTALLLDRLLGEPARFHPLVGFGNLARSVERHLHGDSRPRGVVAVLLLLTPFTAAAALLETKVPMASAAMVWLAIGWRSLDEHARRVADALLGGDLPAARQRVAMLVSRDTSSLSPPAVAGATVESVLENGNDALFGALFWFVVAGAPGVVLYRLANTLDAMWGYRNDRYRQFGWAAARLDDLLNILPARLTALGYTLCGRSDAALACWRRQGRRWKSPNAGPVMAAGAGALDIRLGGPATYHGRRERRPLLGLGRRAKSGDIGRARRLVARTLLLWMTLLTVGESLVRSRF